MISKLNNKWLIFGLIFIIAIILRFTFLSRGALLGDEPAYSLRSIGLVDTLGSDLQTTPLDWYDQLPWWANFSFHDHPPLTFWINHIFFSFSDDSIFASRLPSAIFGLLTIWLVYLLAKKIFKKESVALLSMALFAVNDFSTLYSRTSMMESITLFFILLAFLLFLFGLENRKYWPVFGFVLGLSILSKYTAIFALPAYLIIVLLKIKNLYKDKYFYFGILAFLLAISPVIIYNLGMYSSVGHFDLQLSFLFNQNPKEWQNLVGKELRGSLLDRFLGLKILASLFSIPIIISFISAVFLYIIKFIKKRSSSLEEILLILLTFFYLLMPLTVGSFPRFLYYLTPFVILLSSLAIIKFLARNKIGFIFIFFLIIYELFFSFNTNILNAASRPIGQKLLFFSEALATPNDGVYFLDKYLNEELEGKKSALKTNVENKAITAVREKFLSRQENQEYYPAMLFYDHRLNLNIVKWVIMRRSIYHGWLTGPIYDIGKSLPSLASKEQDIMIYFINGVDKSLYRPNITVMNPHPDLIADSLKNAGIEPVVIYNQGGQPMFNVFKLSAKDMLKALSQ